MRILVTGGAGYIGSMLVPALVEEGYEVVVVDNLTFGNNIKKYSGFTLYERDCLDIDPTWLENVETVIHLAGLSNDPMANFRPRDNYIHNTALTGLLAYLCIQKGVKRFIFGGTCSIYGYSSEKIVDEKSPVAPSFPYGISKMQCEHALNSAADGHFRPIIFRQATVYGWSPRMRFDLVVNTMTKYGVCYGKIVVHNPKLWRPLIHIRDLIEVYKRAVKAPNEISGTFNVSSENYTILDIAREVKHVLMDYDFPCELEVHNRDDSRSYRVDSNLVREKLGFEPAFEIRDAVDELLQKSDGFCRSDWESPWFINAEVYRRKVLLEEKTFKMWRRFLTNIKDEFDHLKAVNWPQEGP